MISPSTRSLIAHLVIAAAVCAAVYTFLAAPMRQRALAAEDELVALSQEAEAAKIALTAMPLVLAEKQAAERRLAEIDRRSGPTLDESVLFAKIMNMADEAGVSLEQVSPGRGTSPGGRQQVGQDALSPRPGDVVKRYTVAGRGAFAGTARFLDAVRSDWAYVTLRECRVTPSFDRQSPEAVTFSLTLDLHAFDTSPIAEPQASAEPTP